MPVRDCAIACPHCFSQTAVRGALAGARRNSAASRVKSSCHVDVVEGIREANGKLQFASTRQQGLKRALSAHAIAIEKRWMGSLGPYEIIAAIMCWSNNHVVPVERLERASQEPKRADVGCRC